MTAQHVETKTQNPWLAALAIAGWLALGLGVLTYLSSMSNMAADAATIAAFGAWVIQVGVVLLVGWLVASAVCWQVSRGAANR